MRNNASSSTKGLKRAGICINESVRPPYLNSFWWRHPPKEYETKTIRKCFWQMLLHTSVLVMAPYIGQFQTYFPVVSLERSTLAYCIQWCPKLAYGRQNVRFKREKVEIDPPKFSWRKETFFQGRRWWNLLDTVAKCMVTAERKKRYPSTNDVAQNCAKLAFVRHKKRRWELAS